MIFPRAISALIDTLQRMQEDNQTSQIRYTYPHAGL